jgi:hypothetical protein
MIILSPKGKSPTSTSKNNMEEKLFFQTKKVMMK